MFDWIKKRLVGGQPAAYPYEEFVREFVAECRRQNVLSKSYDPNARAFVFVREDGSEMTYYMHNGFREWLVRDRGRPQRIDDTFGALGRREFAELHSGSG